MNFDERREIEFPFSFEKSKQKASFWRRNEKEWHLISSSLFMDSPFVSFWKEKKKGWEILVH